MWVELGFHSLPSNFKTTNRLTETTVGERCNNALLPIKKCSLGIYSEGYPRAQLRQVLLQGVVLGRARIPERHSEPLA